MLGNAYMLGMGVARDNAKAVEWYRKSAVQGNVSAQEVLKGAGLKW